MKQTKQLDGPFVQRALAAYFRSARGGEILDQPANDSGVEKINGKLFVVLRKRARGILAVYRVKNDSHLKRLRRYPKALE